MPVKTKLPEPTESESQQQVMEWAEANAYKYPELVWLHHIPNGGHRTKAAAGKLKAEGVKPGVPDLCLPVARGGYIGLYIEMKTRKGEASIEQITWLRGLQELGHCTGIAHSADTAIQVLTEYLEGKMTKEPATPERRDPHGQT